MPQPLLAHQRTELLGAKVDLVTPDEVLAYVADAAEQGRKAVVANHNLHSLYLARRNPDMAALFDLADLVEIDSMPMIYWGKLLGLPTSPAHRCTYLDWRERFWSLAAQRGWRVYYLGGAPHVAEEAARRLMQRWPGVQIAAHHGYFDKDAASAQNGAVLAAINAFRPHVLFVGMGMPVQEAWIHRNYHSLERGVVLPVGAAFDYEAGVQAAAPRIVGALGLEWLFRLACAPRRLFRRYLIEPWSLMDVAIADLRRHVFRRRGPLPDAELRMDETWAATASALAADPLRTAA